MVHGRAESWEREQRLDEAVTSYLKAADAGQCPRREEWVARYPDLAAELADYFAGLDQVDSWALPLRLVAGGVALQPGPASGVFRF